MYKLLGMLHTVCHYEKALNSDSTVYFINLETLVTHLCRQIIFIECLC